jgi:hypothetical protein
VRPLPISTVVALSIPSSFHTQVFAPPFAHEPDVMRGPKGEWVMLYSAYNPESARVSVDQKGYNASSLAKAVCTNCSNGFTPPQGSPGCPFQRGTPSSLNHPMVQMMAIASSPDGPWEQQEIHALTVGWDWNTALTINDDGSAVALIRGERMCCVVWYGVVLYGVVVWYGVVWYTVSPSPTFAAGGMVWHASDYSDNTTWKPVGVSHGQSPQWPTGVEDPYVYRDGNGIYHAIAHAFTPFYGVHAFVHPTDVPSNFSDQKTSMNWTLGGVAYG